MARGTRSLWVAVAAAVLLVVVVSVDASVNRSFSLEVETDDGWRSLTTDGFSGPYPGFGADLVVEANRSDELTFRLSVDNEPPWGYEAPFRVTSHGRLIAQGTLSAAGGGQGEAAFRATVDELVGEGPSPRDGRLFANLEIQLDDGATFVHGGFAVDEVPQEGAA